MSIDIEPLKSLSSCILPSAFFLHYNYKSTYFFKISIGGTLSSIGFLFELCNTITPCYRDVILEMTAAITTDLQATGISCPGESGCFGRWTV